MWVAICPSAYLDSAKTRNGHLSSIALFEVSDRLRWVAECLLVVKAVPNGILAIIAHLF